jgi:hypothetical protein
MPFLGYERASFQEEVQKTISESGRTRNRRKDNKTKSLDQELILEYLRTSYADRTSILHVRRTPEEYNYNIGSPYNDGVDRLVQKYAATEVPRILVVVSFGYG